MFKKIIITIAFILLAVAILGGLFLFIKDRIEIAEKNKLEERPSITSLATLPPKSEETQPVKEASESEEEKEEKIEEEKKEEAAPTNITNNETAIVVLNGGAASGSAGTIKKLLEGGKYENVEANDALNSNHIGQMVYYKKGMEDAAKKIKDLVIDKYPGIDIKEGKTAEQISADIVIMLGG